MKRLATPFLLIVKYLQGAYREFRHVTWPSKQAVTQYTILVISTIVFSVLIIMAFDYGMRQVADRYLIR